MFGRRVSPSAQRCEVYWGADFCALQRNHDGPHIGIASNEPPPYNMTLAGADAPSFTAPGSERGRFRRRRG